MNEQNNKVGAVMALYLIGFVARLFVYGILYVPLTAIFDWIIIMTFSHPSNNGVDAGLIGDIFAYFIAIVPTTIPFVLWELHIRSVRRKWGVSLYKNVMKEVEAKIKAGEL